MGEIDVVILDLARDLLLTTILVAGPILLVGLFVGVAVSLFQALTSVQEQTMSFVPKMLAILFVTLLLLAPALQILRDFTHRILEGMVAFGVR